MLLRKVNPESLSKPLAFFYFKMINLLLSLSVLITLSLHFKWSLNGAASEYL